MFRRRHSWLMQNRRVTRPRRNRARQAICGDRIAPDAIPTVSSAAPVSLNVAHLVVANSASRPHRCFRLPQKTREKRTERQYEFLHRKECDQRQVFRHGVQSSTDNSAGPILLRAILERLRKCPRRLARLIDFFSKESVLHRGVGFDCCFWASAPPLDDGGILLVVAKLK